MFNKYVNISDMYDGELKKVDEELSNLSQDDPKFEELKNLSLLKSTGFLSYAKEQENYSRQILNDFINT